MPHIHCGKKVMSNCSANFVITNSNGPGTFSITDTKLLQQLQSGFKGTINYNKWKPKVSLQKQNQYLHYLIDPNFQGMNKLFVLSFENNAFRTVHTFFHL